MPWRAVRNALGMCCFGSAVSAEVSELVWMQNTPRSRATSCTANEPDEASPSISSSQPSVLTSSRATRAASCGAPLELRITISICRPASPPDALTFSTSSITALRDEVPSCATRPDRMVGMPILMVLACARATHGAANVAAPAPIIASVARRLTPGLRVLVIVPSLSGLRSQIPAGDRVVSVRTRFQSKGGDVKPKMNYNS